MNKMNSNQDGGKDKKKVNANKSSNTVYCICKSSDTERFMM